MPVRIVTPRFAARYQERYTFRGVATLFQESHKSWAHHQLLWCKFKYKMQVFLFPFTPLLSFFLFLDFVVEEVSSRKCGWRWAKNSSVWGKDYSGSRLKVVAQNLVPCRLRWQVHSLDIEVGRYNFLNFTHIVPNPRNRILFEKLHKLSYSRSSSYFTEPAISYTPHNRPLLSPDLSQINPCHFLSVYFFNI